MRSLYAESRESRIDFYSVVGNQYRAEKIIAMKTRFDKQKYLTPPAAADLLGVSPEKVIAFILRGELHAVNLSLGTRPRWRIAIEALEEFCKSRSNSASVAPKRVKPKFVPTPTKEWF
jgi:hypothetical protein